MTTPAEVIDDALEPWVEWDADPSCARDAILEALASAGYAIVPKEQVTWFRIDDPEHPAPKDDGARILIAVDGDVHAAIRGPSCEVGVDVVAPTHWRPLPPPEE